MMAKVSSQCPVFGFCRGPQMPAIPRTFLPLDDSRYFGRGSGAVFFHSKKELTGMIAAIVHLLFPRMERQAHGRRQDAAMIAKAYKLSMRTGTIPWEHNMGGCHVCIRDRD